VLFHRLTVLVSYYYYVDSLRILTYSAQGVDNVVQMTIVTADGRHITTNARTNSDLFWALRGGGGGTYGVLTSATYRTHPVLPVSSSFFTSNITNTTSAKTLISEYIRINPSLADAGWGGYGFFGADGLISLMVAPNVSIEQANATWSPFFEFAHKLAGEGVIVTNNFTVPYNGFYEWYQQFFNSDGQVGINQELASRLLSRDVLVKDHDKVTQTIFDIRGIAWQYVLTEKFRRLLST
jgi:FAD/FMN-containing dehydrogenase